jgi:hypothetical protein
MWRLSSERNETATEVQELITAKQPNDYYLSVSCAAFGIGIMGA